MATPRELLTDLFPKGDSTFVDYIVGCLEDEHFEYGEEGEEAFDAIGHFLVRPCMVSKDQDPTHACYIGALAVRFSQDSLDTS